MATKKPKTASTCLFLFLLSFLSLSISSSGTLVGLSYSVKGNSAYSFPGEVVSFLNLNKASPGVSVDLYLNESLVKSLLHSESSAVSWLHTHVETLLPHFSIRSIVLISRSENFSGKDVLARLKAFHLVLSKVHLGRKVKVSVALSLSLLENLKTSQPRDLQRIFGFVEKIRSFVTIEACIDGELGFGDHLVQLIREARFNLPSNDVPVIFTLKSLVAPGARVAAELVTKVSKYLESKTELYAEVSSLEDFLQENLISSPRRELRNNLKITSHDILNPPTTIFQTTPPGSNPPDFPTPTIVTVPATNPVTVTPANPSLTPLPIPSTTPVNIPPATPVNPPGPVTNPTTVPAPIMVPGAQPITNPVTTYPAPAGNVPVTTPVTNPVTPPAQINAPAIPGQSWCVARSGAPETQLQSALDYACGIGGADCSLIQQGGSCYNPDTLQSHASFAFNSYYQKNPVATSCDFGGTAVIVSTNPSSGSCVYPSSASSSSTSSMTPPSTTPTTPTTPTTTPTPTPIATAPPATTTASPLLPGVPGSVTPPTVLNSSSPNTVFGSDSPPVVNTSTTTSVKAQHLKGYFTLVISFVTGIIILQI